MKPMMIKKSYDDRKKQQVKEKGMAGSLLYVIDMLGIDKGMFDHLANQHDLYTVSDLHNFFGRNESKDECYWEDILGWECNVQWEIKMFLKCCEEKKISWDRVDECNYLCKTVPEEMYMTYKLWKRQKYWEKPPGLLRRAYPEDEEKAEYARSLVVGDESSNNLEAPITDKISESLWEFYKTSGIAEVDMEPQASIGIITEGPTEDVDRDRRPEVAWKDIISADLYQVYNVLGVDREVKQNLYLDCCISNVRGLYRLQKIFQNDMFHDYVTLNIQKELEVVVDFLENYRIKNHWHMNIQEHFTGKAYVLYKEREFSVTNTRIYGKYIQSQVMGIKRAETTLLEDVDLPKMYYRDYSTQM